jgi:ASC-1-like (ASCH) protein
MKSMKNLQNLEKIIKEKVNLKNLNTKSNLKSICDYSKQELLFIFKNFSKRLKPIYWSQKQSFIKLLNYKERTTRILEINNNPIWILVFKNNLAKEDKVLKLKNWYLEIKSLFLWNKFGEGNIRLLRNELINVIKKEYTHADGIYVTVSTTKAKESYEMFLKLWFLELYKVYNEYSKGNIEAHLFYPINLNIKPQNWTLTIKKDFFKEIKKWKKTVEGRSGKLFYSFKKWDIITFKNWKQYITKKIIEVIRYKNLDDFLENEWIENCLPWINNKNIAKKIYLSLPWYKEKIKKYGIIAFKF